MIGQADVLFRQKYENNHNDNKDNPHLLNYQDQLLCGLLLLDPNNTNLIPI